MSRAAPIDLTIDSSPEVTPARLPLPPRHPAPLPEARGNRAEPGPEAVPNGSGSPSSRRARFDYRRPATISDAHGGQSSSPRRARLPSDDSIISISDDSDDETPVAAGPSRPRARLPPRGREFQDNLNALNATLDRHGAELERIRALERAQLRAAEAAQPQAPPTGPRIALGGAVFRNGSREVRFAPGQPPQHFRVAFDGQQAEPQPIEPPSRRMPRRGVRDHLGVLPGFLRPDGEGNHDYNAAGPGPGSIAASAPPRYGRLIMQDYLGMDLLNRLPPARAVGIAVAVPVNDVRSIVDKVALPVIPPPRQGCTHTWDADELEAGTTIELDDKGKVVTPKTKPYLACANCPEPLRISSAARNNDDRIWALRCGHLLDERCAKVLSTGDWDQEPEPEPEPEELDGPSPKRRRTRRTTKAKPKSKVKKAPVVEHSWNCPTCSHTHVSQLVDGEWKQKEGFGAIQLFV